MPETRLKLTTDADAATRLHLLEDALGEDVSVWLDTDIGVCDGLCIGLGRTRAEAIEDAKTELLERLADLEAAKVVRS